jgi:hypothetical protein
MKPYFSKIALLFIFLVLLFKSAVDFKIWDNKLKTIINDGYGYYSYLPAIFIFKDTKKYTFVENQISKYKPSQYLYQVVPTVNNSRMPLYNIGQAILWLPFFGVAHVYALLSGYEADGLSYPYQLGVWCANFFYILLGLFYFRKLLLLLFSDKVTSITMLGIYCATNLYYYNVYGVESTHSYLFCLLAMFIYFFYKYKLDNNGVLLLKSSLILGLMVLVRSSEIILILIPLFYYNQSLMVKKNIFANIIIVCKMMLIIFLVFALQLFYYKLNIGIWFTNAYKGHSFDFLHPHIYDCMFGFLRGWLVYTPIFIFLFFGLLLLHKYCKPFQWSIIMFVSINCYVLFSWSEWTYGTTFSCRPVTQSYVLFGIVLACIAQWLMQKHNFFKTLGGVLLGWFIGLNIFQTIQYRNNIIPNFRTSKNYFLHSFFDTKINFNHLPLVDIEEYLYNSANQTWQPFASTHTTFTSHGSADKTPFVDIFNINLDTIEVQKISDNWVRITVIAQYYLDECTETSCPMLVTDFLRNEKHLKYNALRIPIVMKNRNLDTFTYNLKLPQLFTGDNFKMYINNGITDSVKITNVTIEYLHK